jgi:hypothetical protein
MVPCGVSAWLYTYDESGSQNRVNRASRRTWRRFTAMGSWASKACSREWVGDQSEPITQKHDIEGLMLAGDAGVRNRVVAFFAVKPQPPAATRGEGLRYNFGATASAGSVSST